VSTFAIELRGAASEAWTWAFCPPYDPYFETVMYEKEGNRRITPGSFEARLWSCWLVRQLGLVVANSTAGNSPNPGPVKLRGGTG
jgi:hypothetical protein